MGDDHPGAPLETPAGDPQRPRGGLPSCRLMILISKGLILRSMSTLQKEKHPAGCFLFKNLFIGSSKSPRASPPSSAFCLHTTPQILLPLVAFFQEAGQSILKGLPAPSWAG